MLNIAKIRKEWFIEQIEILKRSGLSYAEIAIRLGVKPQYLNSIKNSGRGASENLTVKLCKTFNINYNDLLERISSYEKHFPEIPEINEPGIEKEPGTETILSTAKTFLHDELQKATQNRTKESRGSLLIKETWERIDVGDLFPDATSAIRHYGDSMPEYPSGCILVLKQVVDSNLIIWGRNYYIETVDLGITKRLQDGGENHVVGYSSNEKTYPDGRLVHEPVKIPKKSIRHINLVLGCVTKEFSKGVIPVIEKDGLTK